MKKILLFGTLLIAQSLPAMQEEDKPRDYIIEFNLNRAIRNSDSHAFSKLLIDNHSSTEKFREFVNWKIRPIQLPINAYQKAINWEEIKNKNDEQIKKLVNDTRSVNPFLLLKGGVLTVLGFALYINSLNHESHLVKITSLLAGGLCEFYGSNDLINGFFYHNHIHNKLKENVVITMLIKNNNWLRYPEADSKSQ